MKKNYVKIVFTAVFMAMVYVVTVALPFPIPATGGYVNIGDTVVLLTAWTLGGIYAGVAAGFGAGLADLFLAPVYAPGTILIKYFMALIAYYICVKLKKTYMNQFIIYFLSGIVAEVFMVLGYFLYEGIILGLGYAAFVGIAGNLLQGGICIVLGYLAILTLEKTKLKEKFFQS